MAGINYKPDAAPLFEGNLTWFPLDWFSLEFSAGYTQTDINAEAFGVSLGFAEFDQIPLLLTARFHWWNRSEKLTLYGGGGLGYYINDAKLSSLFSTAIPGMKLSADDSFGFHAAGGVEWFLTPSWALNFDLKYIINKADFILTVPGGELSEDDIINLARDGLYAAMSVCGSDYATAIQDTVEYVKTQMNAEEIIY